jgi:plastocyanin
MRRALAGAALLAAGAALPAAAGTLQFQVKDRDGRPVAEVVVLVTPAVPVAPKPAPEPVPIVQEKQRFQPFLTVVPAGSTLRFVNHDGYDHHVRSVPSGPLGTPAASEFELRLEAAPDGGPPADEAARRRLLRAAKDVVVAKAGPIGLGCHLHASMRGQIYVAGTPWAGKTDADGRLQIDGIPDGAVQVTLWHADQLQAQAPLAATVAPGTGTLEAALNFAPRRRRF